MKIIHTADIHLGSKMDSRYPRELVQKRKEELKNTFLRMVEYAQKNEVKVILLCGDLFDSDTPLKKEKDFFYSVVKDFSSIDFLYLKGNHDLKGGYDGEKPENLYLFGNDWEYYFYDNVVIGGIEITSDNYMSFYSTLKIILNIADDERDIERYDELQNELFEQEEILNKIKREYDLLTKTVDYLNAADRIIKDKYVKPVRDIFVKYSNAIEYAFGEKVVMDPNFNVRFEQNGVERSEAYLSSGQKGVCAFCFRLALLENMYSKEKPFLILDDPFVFLDEQNHQKIKELLNSLAAYFQIIYFTCHTSRKI